MSPLRLVIACGGICLGKGGTERAAINLAVEMQKRGHEVLLLSWMFPQSKSIPAYSLPKDLRHLSVDFSGAHDNIDHLRKFLIAYDADVFLAMESMEKHLFWTTICMGTGIPLIGSMRTFLGRAAKLWSQSGLDAVYSGCDFIHILLPEYEQLIQSDFRHKTICIPNAAPVGKIGFRAKSDSRKRIVFLGRFSAVKRVDLLLNAFKLLIDRFPEWDLLLWGQGELEEELRKQAARLGLGDRARFMGLCENVAQAYAQGDIFCLPSSGEGFPNTVLEAMGAGLPVVGVADCAAMASILKNDVGLCSPGATPNELADTLAKLMSDDAKRQIFSARSLEAVGKYQPEKIYGQWEELFHKAAARKGHTVMDAFYDEPFASKARLSSAARREWLFRDFGDLFPYSAKWWQTRCIIFFNRLASLLKNKIKNFMGFSN